MPGIDLRDVERIREKILNLGEKAAPRVRRMLLAAAKVIYEETDKIVPEDKGPLRASGQVGLIGTGLASEAFVSYGGPDAPYVVWVHEDPTKTHGQAFNVKHAAEIAAGFEKARRPEERFKFLEEVARTKLFRVREAVIKELNK